MEQEMGTGSVKHDKMHWRCCWQPLTGTVIWLLALLALIFAWVAKDTVFLGYTGLGWYWNALVLGVLAIPLRLKDNWCKEHGDGHCGR